MCLPATVPFTSTQEPCQPFLHLYPFSQLIARVSNCPARCRHQRADWSSDGGGEDSIFSSLRTSASPPWPLFFPQRSLMLPNIKSSLKCGLWWPRRQQQHLQDSLPDSSSGRSCPLTDADGDRQTHRQSCCLMHSVAGFRVRVTG